MARNYSNIELKKQRIYERYLELVKADGELAMRVKKSYYYLIVSEEFFVSEEYAAHIIRTKLKNGSKV